jgi:NAD(P)-dependent dehydrogenase (short-subunit alcohol dehydrogenase family)
MHSLPAGYNAVVIGARGGIGSAICELLSTDARLGKLIGLSRSKDGLDLTDEDTISSHARRLTELPLHLLVCATGGLTIGGVGPEKSLRQIDPDNMLRQFKLNTIGPALIAKHFLPLLDRRQRCIGAFLSARVGSIGDNRLGGWISYRASKAALNQVVKTASIELARTHRQSVVLSMHPGTVQTPLSSPYSAGHPTIAPHQAASLILAALNGISPERTGGFFAYDGSQVSW